MMFFEKWNIEMGIPCPADIAAEATDTVEATEFPSGKYIKTIHKGAYRNFRETYRKIAQYAAMNNLQLAGTSIEIYLNEPGKVDEEELETEVLAMIKE